MSTNTPYDPYGPEYQAQARIITNLRAELARKDEEIFRLNTRFSDGIFYKHIAEAVKNHEHLRDSWLSFVAMLRLSEPELENRARDEIVKASSYIY